MSTDEINKQRMELLRHIEEKEMEIVQAYTKLGIITAIKAEDVIALIDRLSDDVVALRQSLQRMG